MAACRNIPSFTKNKQKHLFRLLVRQTARTCTKSASAGSNQVIVPYRIERGPTDILKALASTVSKDFTAPHYKYEDDPYLIPSSNITKRAFALSKESGKKAARYFLEKYPELFVVNKSVPFIRQFDPPVVYSEENITDTQPLVECLKEHDVNNSIHVYSVLKKKGISASQELKQDLLELLCFYNSAQPPSEEYCEERYFQRTTGLPGDKWNATGKAEELFEEMDKDSQAYSAMIAGTSKYLNADMALLLYEEMKTKNLKASLEAYNGLISVIHLLKEDNATRWEFAIQFLSKMKLDGLRPDLYTMNSLLFLLTKCSRWKGRFSSALRLLAEMKHLHIEPSLGSYYRLLMIFCASDFKNAGILHEIMKEIEGKEFNIRHPSDVMFFVTAMEVCWKGLNDKSLAYRLHKLLESANNCKILGNALSESLYFKSFFNLFCKTEEIDKLMEIYEKYVPHTYTPEPSVTLAVIEAIHFNGHYRHLPRMCSDVLLFEQTERPNIMETLLEAAGCKIHEETVQTNTMNMVWGIIEKQKQRNAQTRRMPFTWTATMLGNVLRTFVNGKDIEKSWSVIKQLKEEETSIVGYPEKECLLKFCEFCFQTENFDKLKYCMVYAINTTFPDFRDDLVQMSDKMFEENKLPSKHRVTLNTLLESSANVDDLSSSDSSSDDESSSDSSDDERNEVHDKKV